MNVCEDLEAGSGHQKKLANQFCRPRLQHSKDKRNARIFWQARKDTGDRTTVVSSWMKREEAQEKLQGTLAELHSGKSWDHMYEILVEACQEVHLLPHKFVMPRVESHSSPSNLARISWMQQGHVVEQHLKDLKQYDRKYKRTFYKSQYVVVVATCRKLEELVTALRNGTSWLSMYESTIKACDELSSSRVQEELAEAASSTYDLEVALEGNMLGQAKDDPDLRGLNLNLRMSELLVRSETRRHAGFRNLGNTCFINATLQLFCHVEALRSQIRNAGNPTFPADRGNVGAAIAKLMKVQRALKELELRYASHKWSVIAPIRLLPQQF